MNKIACFLVLVLLLGCGRGYEVTELYEQKVKNSNISIFEYHSQSNLNDGDRYGFVLNDVSEDSHLDFTQELDLKFITSFPFKDTIFIIEFLDGETSKPQYEATKVSAKNGIIIVKDCYKLYNESFGNLKFTFDSFEDINDSLIIKGLEEDYFIMESKNVAFKKGNIKLKESTTEKGVLNSILVPSFLFPQFIGGTIDKVTKITHAQLKYEGLVYLEFIPNSRIEIKEFSDYGFYKKKAIKSKR